jgi:hypothetical protein
MIYRLLDDNFLTLNDQVPMAEGFPADMEMMMNINPISNINISNLTSEDQVKFMNITNLQNLIQNTQMETQKPIQVKEVRGEVNIRRELTDREKIELEMKKWKKAEQKRVDCFNLV